MKFEEILKELKNGHIVTNNKWNGKGMFLAIQHTTDLSKMTLPYIYMSNADGDMVPWLASQQDMFSDEWEVIDTHPYKTQM